LTLQTLKGKQKSCFFVFICFDLDVLKNKLKNLFLTQKMAIFCVKNKKSLENGLQYHHQKIT